jgi:TonB family protein
VNAPARLSSFLAVVLALSTSLSSQAPAQQTAASSTPPDVHAIGEAGLRAPRVLHQVTPQYTAAAMRARIEGSVLLEAVVDVDGHVGAIHIARSLDELNGLDEQAVRALEQWTFMPGTKDGVAVPVRITVQLSFALSAPLTLPEAFSSLESPRGDWQEASVDDSGMRITVSYPPGWNAVPSPASSDRLLRIERIRDRATDEFQITPVKPAPPGFNLNAPMGRERLQQVSGTIMQTLTQHGGTLKASGQTRLGNRYWWWAEVHGPPTDAGRDAVDLYLFSTTEGDRVLQVGCSVLMPKGSSADETAAGIQSAASSFVEMLNRLRIEPISK